MLAWSELKLVNVRRTYSNVSSLTVPYLRLSQRTMLARRLTPSAITKSTCFLTYVARLATSPLSFACFARAFGTHAVDLLQVNSLTITSTPSGMSLGFQVAG